MLRNAIRFFIGAILVVGIIATFFAAFMLMNQFSK